MAVVASAHEAEMLHFHLKDGLRKDEEEGSCFLHDFGGHRSGVRRHACLLIDFFGSRLQLRRLRLLFCLRASAYELVQTPFHLRWDHFHRPWVQFLFVRL